MDAPAPRSYAVKPSAGEMLASLVLFLVLAGLVVLLTLLAIPS